MAYVGQSLSWESTAMAKMTPTIRGDRLVYQQDEYEQGLVVGTPAWYAWLETASTFAFTSGAGTFTARKERAGNQRGGWYWKAYRMHQGKLSSRYLGKSETLSLERLHTVAQALTSLSVPDRKAVRPATDTQRDPLLATKLHVPRPRAQLVSRPGLIERVQEGIQGPLTLVSAPAGFGKTTLLAQWLAEGGMPVAWLSLEPEENEPVRFLSYVFAAIQQLDPDLDTTALALLQSPQSVPPERVLAVLTNELASREEGDFALVLDDYHAISASPVHGSMIFLLEHLPPRMHLVIATRADPPLPLARLRARGQLTEIRAAELRFTAEETRAFLKTVMGLELPPNAIDALESRTEGWIAGLQLAALSLQDRADVSSFLAAFSGSHRFVLDYISEEVLSRQPAQVQSFLLSTSILSRLTGPLCDAIREQGGSQAMLERLEQANLFVVSLDEERRWYRYHQLFAEVLKSRLQQIEPTLVPELHRRASVWYEQHALVVEAVQHALASANVERVAHLIELHWVSVASRGYVQTLLGWLEMLPEALMQTRPRLCLVRATMLVVANQLDEVPTRLHAAEQALQAHRADLEASEVQLLHGQIAMLSHALAFRSGDLAGSAAFARQALDLEPPTELVWRTGLMLAGAHTYLVSGDVTPASEHLVADAVAHIRALIDLPQLVMWGTLLLARLHVLQGQLRRAAATYAEALQIATSHEELPFLVDSPAYSFGLGDVLREWNQLDEAERYLTQGMDLIKGTLTVDADLVLLGYTALARLQQARGEYSLALATLAAFTQLAHQRHFFPVLVGRSAAVQAQVELAQGNLAAATRWADENRLSTSDDDLSYLREREYLTLARVRIEEGRDDPAGPFLQDALHLLHRLLQDAEAKARMGSALEILVLRALAFHAQGDHTEALSALERALLLAEAEGYVRLFVDEGPPMLALLRLAHTRGMMPEYVTTLLSAFGRKKEVSVHLSHSLVEPLTEREREVLQWLAAGASNREIARRLVLSLGTVKKHVSNICGKLDVQSRTQAVARARVLHLL
jgi:LuxR family transcriptional regulator, maltose regulon positive regulatory protein